MTTVIQGLTMGFGVGAFFIAPWTMINNAYATRPFKLTLIDAAMRLLAVRSSGSFWRCSETEIGVPYP